MYPSRKMYSPQAFVSFWKPFIRIFQVFCVSHYSLFHSSEHIGRLIYYITFSSLHIALMVYTLANGLIIQMRPSNKYKESTLMFYVNSISVAGNFVTHTVAHLEPLFTRKYEEEIYRKLNDINEMFALKLHYVVNFDAIRNKFIRRTMLFFTITASISIGYSFYSLPSDGDTLKTFLFLLNRVLGAAIIRARRCQLAFLVNTLSNTLLDLQILLKRQQQNYRPNSANSSANSSENIRYLRDIYSTVWLLKNLISNCFGWSFISFLMEFSFDLINSSYWAYINVKIYDSNNMIIQIICFITTITMNFWYYCMISERCQNMGKGVSKALHTPSNYQDRNYQRFIRIFSLQIRKQPIEIKMKQMFTFNYALLKSTIVLLTTYIAILVQFQISEENVPPHLKTGKSA